MKDYYEIIYSKIYSEPEIKEREEIKAEMNSHWVDAYWKVDLTTLRNIRDDVVKKPLINPELIEMYKEKYSYLYDEINNDYEKIKEEINNRYYRHEKKSEREKEKQEYLAKAKQEFLKIENALDKKIEDLAEWHDFPETFSSYEAELMQKQGYTVFAVIGLHKGNERIRLYKLKKP